MAGKTILTTERLLLREFDAADADAFLPLGSDPEITRYTGDGGLTSVDEARAALLAHPIADYRKHGFGRWACVLKATDSVIGFAGLKYLDDLQEVDIGYRLLLKYWGQGLASEAAREILTFGFERLGLRQIVGLVHPENAASIRVLTKIGMHYAGDIDYRSQRVARYLCERSATCMQHS